MEPDSANGLAPDKGIRSRWRRRILLATGAVFPLCLVLTCAWYVHILFANRGQSREAIAEADRLDPGWRWDELEAKRAVIPDDENAALRVLAAKDLLPNPWPTPRTPPRAQKGQPQSEEDEEPISLIEDIPEQPPELLRSELAQELRTELAKAAPALVEARWLSKLSGGRYSVSWPISLVVLPRPAKRLGKLAYCYR